MTAQRLAKSAPDRTPLIVAKGLGVNRGGHWVLRDIDLDLAEGEVITLIGPNGGGKTTLIRCLLGLIKPDAGTMRRAAGLRIGYVPQRFQIDPAIPLTVRRLLSLMRPAADRAALAAVAETGVAHVLDRAVQDLSGGELQRVLLARALLAEPQLLVLDEPVQGVDPGGEAALYRLIGDLRDRHGLGVLIASHDLHLVMAETDTVLCLNGHICCSGRPQQVSEHPAYLSLFGSRSAALAVYRHEHDHSHGLDGGVAGSEEPPPHGDA